MAKVLASLLDSVVVLGVAFDGDAVVRSVETDVHRLAVGPGDLDLVRGAVLRVALDGVGLAAAGDLQSCGLGSVGAGAGELGVVVEHSCRAGDRHTSEREGGQNRDSGNDHQQSLVQVSLLGRDAKVP